MFTDLGPVIRSLRKQHRLSQLELADRLSISQQSISKYESAGVRPDYDTLARMADLFHVPIAYFLRPDDYPDVGILTRENDQLRELCHDNPDLMALFDLGRSATPQQLKQAIAIIRSLRGVDDDA